MSRMIEVKTCRHCLGNGCCHCGNRGQVGVRLMPGDVEARRTLAWLRNSAYMPTAVGAAVSHGSAQQIGAMGR